MQNLHHDYAHAVRRLRDFGVMVNGSFVFGMDADEETVFSKTVEWAITEGIETATFHILTPYPGTALHNRMQQDGRILHSNWDLYDTRHAVFQPKRLSPSQLEVGYRTAYKDFYRWGSILRGASAKQSRLGQLRHLAYAAGWKKFEPLWDFIIRCRRITTMLPLLETILSEFGKRSTDAGIPSSPALEKQLG